jgi:alginate O-acetyltransferase complex protein AlgI
LWGAYYALLLIAEKLFLLRVLERIPRMFRHLYTLVTVTVGFVIFSAPSLSDAVRVIGTLFGIGTLSGTSPVITYQLTHILPLLLISALSATPLPRLLFSRVLQKTPKSAVIYPVLTALSLLLCVAYLVDSTFSPFAYLQF